MISLPNPYDDPSSVARMALAYGNGQSLDAKWEVMRRYRSMAASFEDWLADQIVLDTTLVVLDAGAGSGRFAIPLARKLKPLGGRVVALDILPDVMDPIRRAIADENLPIEILVADVENMPQESGPFDLVLAAHMLYHCRNIPETVGSLKQTLTPRGLFVATTNAFDGMPELFEIHADTMRTLGIPFLDGPPPQIFTLENGEDLLGSVFSDVQLKVYDGGFTVNSADPVFTYYASTEVYRVPMRDSRIPWEVRLRIAPTFVHLAQERCAEPLAIRKLMGAFLCR